MCRRVDCFYANGCTNVVIHCSFYPTLDNLPTDCRIPEIMMDLDKSDNDAIIELTEEVITK